MLVAHSGVKGGNSACHRDWTVLLAFAWGGLGGKMSTVMGLPIAPHTRCAHLEKRGWKSIYQLANQTADRQPILASILCWLSLSRVSMSTCCNTLKYVSFKFRHDLCV